jgi:hypothetical protein
MFQQPLGLPSAPPGLQPQQQAPGLPTAPPSARAGLWDPGNRHKTLLAIGTGLLSGHSFADGVGAAGRNVFALDDQLQAASRKTREFGGPDNSFEIITDPATGHRTTRAVPEFQEYLEHKRVKAKDTADINGRAMFSLAQLPEKDRPGAYAAIRANPEQYGVDPTTMPDTYDPHYVAMAAGMGMTVSQGLTRQRADQNADNLQDYRKDLQADRETRTGIYRDRAAATTAQGNARIAQGAQRISISQAKGSGGGGKGSNRPAGRKLNPANNDLSYLK